MHDDADKGERTSLSCSDEASTSGGVMLSVNVGAAVPASGSVSVRATLETGSGIRQAKLGQGRSTRSRHVNEVIQARIRVQSRGSPRIALPIAKMSQPANQKVAMIAFDEIENKKQNGRARGSDAEKVEGTEIKQKT